MESEKMIAIEKPTTFPCLSRRSFIFSGTAAATCMFFLPSGLSKEPVPGIRVRYPQKKIASVSALQEGMPISFTYINDDFGSNFLVKLGQEAGGGVGPHNDIVAFNGVCTHMGGNLSGLYKHQYKAVGPCPLHLTSFDLTRFGMVLSGHASESLPQVTLKIEGDNIYAIGFQGLVYGQNTMS